MISLNSSSTCSGFPSYMACCIFRPVDGNVETHQSFTQWFPWRGHYIVSKYGCQSPSRFLSALYQKNISFCLVWLSSIAIRYIEYMACCIFRPVNEYDETNQSFTYWFPWRGHYIVSKYGCQSPARLSSALYSLNWTTYFCSGDFR